MRKLTYVLIILIAMLGLMVTPAVLAQDTTLSTGCSGASGSSGSGDFLAGEALTFSVVGDLPTGGSWTVTVNGSEVFDSDTDTSYTYNISSDGAISFSTATTGATFEIAVSCSAGDSADIDFTLCHIPPGNPQAAHTITVGSLNAYNTHISRHGDTPGMCPPGEESRFLDDSAGLVIFVIFDDPDDDEETTEVISLWGNCEDGECESLVNVLIVDIVALVGTLDINGYVSFDADDDDGYEVRVYYLGYQDRDGDGSFTEVFQINIYFNDVLTNDDVLIVINDEGGVGWELNAEIGVDISILFSGDDDDSDDSDDTDDSDDSDDTDDTDDDDSDDSDDSGDDSGA